MKLTRPASVIGDDISCVSRAGRITHSALSLPAVRYGGCVERGWGGAADEQMVDVYEYYAYII